MARALQFSAYELREVSQWPDPLIEDYLDLRDTVNILTPTVREVDVDYQVLPVDSYVVVDSGIGAGITLTFPIITSAVKAVTFLNESAFACTLDGNGSTVQNGTNLAAAARRTFIKSSTGWLEV